MSYRRDIHGKLTHLRKASTSYPEVSTGARMTSPLSFCGGKEYSNAFGEAQYDQEARTYIPIVPFFSTMDPLCHEMPWISPISFCAGNPIMNIDPDGKWAFLIPFGKALLSAGIDITAQLTAHDAYGKDFFEAVDALDWTSVFAAAITGAILSPGMSTSAKIAAGSVILTDACVDISASGGVESVFQEDNHKPIINACIEVGTAYLPSKGVSTLTKSCTNDITNTLTSKSAATMTKAEKNELRQIRDIINSDVVQTGAISLADFIKGICVNATSIKIKALYDLELQNEKNKGMYDDNLNEPQKSLFNNTIVVPPSKYYPPTDAIQVKRPTRY